MCIQVEPALFHSWMDKTVPTYFRVPPSKNVNGNTGKCYGIIFGNAGKDFAEPKNNSRMEINWVQLWVLQLDGNLFHPHPLWVAPSPNPAPHGRCAKHQRGIESL